MVELLKAFSETSLLRKKKSQLPLPFHEKIWVDYFYCMSFLLFQIILLPIFFPSNFLINITTPYLVLSYISLPLRRSIGLTIFATLALETHSATPMGMYFVIYLIISVCIALVRKNVLWHSPSPWKFFFIVSQTSVFLWEFFVGFVTGSLWFGEVGFYLGNFVKIIASMFIGMMMLAKFKCKPYTRENDI